MSRTMQKQTQPGLENNDPKIYNAVSHDEVLNLLLKQLQSIDFRELAALKSDEKLQKKHYIVYVVEEILKAARIMGGNFVGTMDKPSYTLELTGKQLTGKFFKAFLEKLRN